MRVGCKLIIYGDFAFKITISYLSYYLRVRGRSWLLFRDADDLENSHMNSGHTDRYAI